jgi:hypothetical protein
MENIKCSRVISTEPIGEPGRYFTYISPSWMVSEHVLAYSRFVVARMEPGVGSGDAEDWLAAAREAWTHWERGQRGIDNCLAMRLLKAPLEYARGPDRPEKT